MLEGSEESQNMKVFFIESLDGEQAGAALFQGEDYVPRLGDFLRVHTTIYKVIHVEWDYPLKGGKPNQVDILLYPIPER